MRDVPPGSPLASNPGMRGYRFGPSAALILPPCPRPAAAARPPAPATEPPAQTAPVPPATPLPPGVTDHFGQRIMPDWSRQISLAFCAARPAGGHPRPDTFHSWCGNTCHACRHAIDLHHDAYYRDVFEPILARYAEARAVLGPEEAALQAANQARFDAERAAERQRRLAAAADADAVRQAAADRAARREAVAGRIRDANRMIENARAHIRAAQDKPPRPAVRARRKTMPEEQLDAAEARALRLEAQAAQAEARAAKADARRRRARKPPILTVVENPRPAAPAMSGPAPIGPQRNRRRGLVPVAKHSQNWKRRGRGFRHPWGTDRNRR
jgi:hypothetical protein